MHKEIITKTPIPNSGNFNIYSSCYNLIDAKGLVFKLSFETDLIAEKIYRKNQFFYLILNDHNQNELYIMPNDSINDYNKRIFSKINYCNDDNDVFTVTDRRNVLKSFAT
jgi:hypothetical protein